MRTKKLDTVGWMRPEEKRWGVGQRVGPEVRTCPGPLHFLIWYRGVTWLAAGTWRDVCAVPREMSDKVSGTIMMNDSPSIVELNVGGVYYSTSLETLRNEPDSLLAKIFSDANRHKAIRDAKGKYFLDRDGVLFRYILDYLRNLKLILPENFHEKDRLRQEAEYFQLPNLVKIINAYPSPRAHHAQLPSLANPKDPQPNSATHLSPQQSFSGRSPSSPPATGDSASPTAETVVNNINSSPSPVSERGSGFITVGYRGTFAFGRDGLADVKFRKLSRIIVCGKVSLCREVFKDTLNESRDPDRGEFDRYTSRFFLKHSFLEQAFDMLQEEGFIMVGSCGSGTNSAGEVKPGLDTEESKWQHYNEFIFERR
ncbi:BTB/POZ domain-containing protein kctd12 [Bulinus truncatus]|nr:BTB/POZ domain-containing protein kctd12 [Bulinus truncatus]